VQAAALGAFSGRLSSAGEANLHPTGSPASDRRDHSARSSPQRAEKSGREAASFWEQIRRPLWRLVRQARRGDAEGRGGARFVNQLSAGYALIPAARFFKLRSRPLAAAPRLDRATSFYETAELKGRF